MVDCPIDCSYVWREADWTVCDPSGKTYRSPKVFYPNVKNGSACPNRQVKSCVYDCCYNWSPWSQCNLDTGIQTRDLIIKYPPVNGGMRCPDPIESRGCRVDCSYGWTPWSTCDINYGTKFRDPVIQFKARNGGDACPLRDVSKCSVDCRYQWDDWTLCDVNNNQMTRNYTTIQPKYKGLACTVAPTEKILKTC